MRIKKIFGLRAFYTIAFLIIAAVIPLIIGCNILGGDSGGGSESTTASTPEDATIPLELLETALTAEEPYTTASHYQLPSSFQADLLGGFSIDSEATLGNIAITRTDGGDSPNPTVDFTVSVASGNAPGACAGGTGTQAFRMEVTGNEDFSSTAVSVDEGMMSQNAFDIIKSRDFTVCTSITSSVGINLSISGLKLSFGVEQSCDAEENQNLAGRWMGTFYCEDVCDGITTITPTKNIELKIYQDDEAAIYIDDGDAIYFGNVCDTEFAHSGFGSGYYEWGTFTITGPDTAVKESTWVDTEDPSCGGTCYDTFSSRSPL